MTLSYKDRLDYVENKRELAIFGVASVATIVALVLSVQGMLSNSGQANFLGGLGTVPSLVVLGFILPRFVQHVARANKDAFDPENEADFYLKASDAKKIEEGARKIAQRQAQREAGEKAKRAKLMNNS